MPTTLLLKIVSIYSSLVNLARSCCSRVVLWLVKLSLCFLLFFPLAPDTPPSDIVVNVVSPYSVSCSWDVPSLPSGVITGYTLYINYRDGNDSVLVPLDSTASSYDITGLSPFQTILIAMSASTAVGEGARSAYVSYTTQETGVGVWRSVWCESVGVRCSVRDKQVGVWNMCVCEDVKVCV